MSANTQKIQRALESGNGVFRLMPNWVPRSFCIPGKRLKLHANDYYAYGAHRGGIDERWLASTTPADNGPETLADEGLSYIYVEEGSSHSRVLLRDAVGEMGKEILGEETMQKHGGWVMFSKFFDNQEPLPFHIHHTDEKAKEIGQKGKPESYFFPPQLNNHGGYFPYTFFGLNPGTTRDDLRRCLEDWESGDNGILYLSKAHKLRPGTGWDVPPGVLHAPGSMLTYEPQRASDVFSMFQSLVWDVYTSKEMLYKDVPADKKGNIDYMISLLDWEKNVDPNFYENRFMAPKPVREPAEMNEAGYQENWIVYKSEYFSAKELTVFPKRTVEIRDERAYGAVVVEGHGTFAGLEISSPSLIRFGEMTQDELFITDAAAKSGIRIENTSETENLVVLKHIGPA